MEAQPTQSPVQISAQHLLQYDLWGNQQILTDLRSRKTPERALAILAHIAAVHRLFLARVCADKRRVEIWPPARLNTLEQELESLHRRWLQILNERDPCEEITYVGSQGEHWRNQLKDIVTHVVIHSAYHRGQIAMLLGTAGIEPADTDFIQAARTGVI